MLNRGTWVVFSCQREQNRVDKQICEDWQIHEEQWRWESCYHGLVMEAGCTWDSRCRILVAEAEPITVARKFKVKQIETPLNYPDRSSSKTELTKSYPMRYTRRNGVCSYRARSGWQCRSTRGTKRHHDNKVSKRLRIQRLITLCHSDK